MLGGNSGASLTIAVPCLDEERYISGCLESLLRQLEARDGEILVLDGGSTDATREIVARMARIDPRIRLIENPKRCQAAAINLAASMASPRSRILMRADAHAHYPKNFIRDCIKAFLQSGADSVVVPMRTKGSNCFQCAVAAAQNTPIGNGGAIHRNGGTAGFVEHGHHAVFNLDIFRQLGGYNESFTHNEDAEFDQRLVAGGGRIFMCPTATVEYFPRDNVAALARQYYNHGRGRARTILIHRKWPRFRQMLPVAALVGSLSGLILSSLSPFFLLAPLAYAATCNGIGAFEALRRRDRCLLGLGIAAMVMHISWALGFLTMFARNALKEAGSSARHLRSLRLTAEDPHGS